VSRVEEKLECDPCSLLTASPATAKRDAIKPSQGPRLKAPRAALAMLAPKIQETVVAACGLLRCYVVSCLPSPASLLLFVDAAAKLSSPTRTCAWPTWATNSNKHGLGCTLVAHGSRGQNQDIVNAASQPPRASRTFTRTPNGDILIAWQQLTGIPRTLRAVIVQARHTVRGGQATHSALLCTQVVYTPDSTAAPRRRKY